MYNYTQNLVIYQWKKINISDTIGISGMKRRKIMRKTDFTEYIIADERKSVIRTR